MWFIAVTHARHFTWIWISFTPIVFLIRNNLDLYHMPNGIQLYSQTHFVQNGIRTYDIPICLWSFSCYVLLVGCFPYFNSILNLLIQLSTLKTKTPLITTYYRCFPDRCLLFNTTATIFLEIYKSSRHNMCGPKYNDLEVDVKFGRRIYFTLNLPVSCSSP